MRIYLYEGDTRLATTIVNADGNWTISDQVFLTPGNHVFTLTDNNGERSEPFVLNVIEATSGKPVIESIYDDRGESGTVISGGSTDDSTPAFNGKGEPGVRIYLYEGATLLASTIVNADGNWTISDQVFLTPGNHVFTLTDNNGERSEPFVLNVIEATSGKPVIESIYDDKGESGTVISGGSTDDNIPTFNGKGEPDTYVHLFNGDTFLTSARVNADGNWTLINQVFLEPGNHVLTLEGYNGERSEPFVLNVTEVSSDKPVIESIYDNRGEPGTVISGGSTDDSTPAFNGKGEPGVRIYLYEGDTRLATTIVNADGNWTISDQVFLTPGNHVFTLTDNNGERSEPFVLNVIEATSGKPVIESAVDNIGADIGLIGNGAITDDARPTLHGRGEPNTTVGLYVDGRYMVSAVVGEDGSWSLLSPRALTPGEHVFTVRGDDVVSDPFVLTVLDAPQAATLVIESALDQTGLSTGVIGDGSATDERQPVFYGHGEPDAPVFLFVSTGGDRLQVGSGVVQPDGTWEVGVDSLYSMASGHNVFTVSDGVSDSAPFTLNIGTDESIAVSAVQDDAAGDVMPLALSLSDLLQDASGELFANEMTLLPVNDTYPELDLSIVVETQGGISTWVTATALSLEPELTYAA